MYKEIRRRPIRLSRRNLHGHAAVLFAFSVAAAQARGDKRDSPRVRAALCWPQLTRRGVESMNARRIVVPVALCLAVFSTSAATAAGIDEQRAGLAHECANGFPRSCGVLRSLNGQEGDGIPIPAPGPASLALLDQLMAECTRGFNKSCEAQRALNGEKEKKTVICRSSGTVADGSYSGTSICR
jgi:hypothetical protein